jgi:2-dehydropantoate 2-reductase
VSLAAHNTQVWVGALQTTPGVIKHTKSEDTQLGLFPNPKLSSADEKKSIDIFAALLREGGTPCRIEEDMQVKRWEKVVWNAAWNSLTTLTLMDTQSWLKSSPSATPITKQLMREVIDVARKSGVQIEYTLIDELLAKILAMPGIGSSMQADLKAGRAMEVEIILGTPVTMAKELGVATPIIDTLYALLTGINLRMKL